MKLALCDDNVTFLNDLDNYLTNYCNEHKLEVEKYLFNCGEDFINSDRDFDIVFMDIYLGDKNGVELVQQLNVSERSKVVFTTSSKEHAIEAFSLNATHYLLKPLSEKDVYDAMERCLSKLNKAQSKMIEIKTGKVSLPIPVDKIIYIESFNKTSTVCTEENNIETYTTLSSIMDAIGDEFFVRAQRSFIVNLKYIKNFSSENLVLSNGKEIPVSRLNRADVKKKYQEFLFNLANSND